MSCCVTESPRIRQESATTSARWPRAADGRPVSPVKWIADNLAPIDHVICSTAERTRQTLEASGLATPTALVDFTDQVYGAEPEDLVPLIAAANAADRTLLVVGHAPGLPDLADELAGKGSDPSALSAMRAKYPTSAVAVLELDGDWADIAAAPTRLVDFVVARS